MAKNRYTFVSGLLRQAAKVLTQPKESGCCRTRSQQESALSQMIRWTPKRILYEIHERGMTLEKLAQFNGRNPSSMRNVWTRANSIDEKIIAEFLDVTPEELWPDRYPKTTSRIYDSAKWGALESKKASASTDTRVAA